MMGFSMNDKSTMVTKNPMAQGLMGRNREGLSHMNKRLANLQYGCIDKWVSKCGYSRDPCKNHGYLGSDCKCVCPEGTTGKICNEVIDEYTEALIKLYLPHNS